MITDKQREERKLGIGGSDIPIIMGLSPYKTPYQLYLEKSGIIEDNQEINESQYWGNCLEGVIREEFSKRNKISIETPETIIHPFYDFMRANIDGYIPDWDAVLEIKCSSSFKSDDWGTIGTDEIPIQHIIQVAYYCALTNSNVAYIAVLIGGNDYREYKYIRDNELESYIIDSAKSFWKCVQNKTPPNAFNQIDLKLMFPKNKENKNIIATNEIIEQLIELNEIRKNIKSLTEKSNSIKFNIMNFMKDSSYLSDEFGNKIASWKTNKKGSRVFLIKGENNE